MCGSSVNKRGGVSCERCVLGGESHDADDDDGDDVDGGDNSDDEE